MARGDESQCRGKDGMSSVSLRYLLRGQLPLAFHNQEHKYDLAHATGAPSETAIWLLQCACSHNPCSWACRSYHASTSHAKHNLPHEKNMSRERLAIHNLRE